MLGWDGSDLQWVNAPGGSVSNVGSTLTGDGLGTALNIADNVQLPGTPTVETQPGANDNSAAVATTAYVSDALNTLGYDVPSKRFTFTTLGKHNIPQHRSAIHPEMARG